MSSEKSSYRPYRSRKSTPRFEEYKQNLFSRKRFRTLSPIRFYNDCLQTSDVSNPMKKGSLEEQIASTRDKTFFSPMDPNQNSDIVESEVNKCNGNECNGSFTFPPSIGPSPNNRLTDEEITRNNDYENKITNTASTLKAFTLANDTVSLLPNEEITRNNDDENKINNDASAVEACTLAKDATSLLPDDDKKENNNEVLPSTPSIASETEETHVSAQIDSDDRNQRADGDMENDNNDTQIESVTPTPLITSDTEETHVSTKIDQGPSNYLANKEMKNNGEIDIQTNSVSSPVTNNILSGTVNLPITLIAPDTEETHISTQIFQGLSNRLEIIEMEIKDEVDTQTNNIPVPVTNDILSDTVKSKLDETFSTSYDPQPKDLVTEGTRKDDNGEKASKFSMIYSKTENFCSGKNVSSLNDKRPEDDWIIPQNKGKIQKQKVLKLIIEDVRVKLELHPSEENKGSNGLFLLYEGKKQFWEVPGNIDLGKYAKNEDVLSEFLFDAKNFVFNGRIPKIHVWNDPQQIYDVTDDFGRFHTKANTRFLPNMQGTANKAVANVLGVLDSNKKPHYVLKKKTMFENGKPKELLVILDNHMGSKTVTNKNIAKPSSMVSKISRFTENEVMEILSFFQGLELKDSEDKFRMHWATEEIKTYCGQYLYGIYGESIPKKVKTLIDDILSRFPDINNSEDEKVHWKNRYFGYCVRQLNSKESYAIGIVDEIVSFHNKKKYKVLFEKGGKPETWEEGKVEDNCSRGSYGEIKPLFI